MARGPDTVERAACKRVRETLDAYQLELLRRTSSLIEVGRARSALIEAVKACLRPELLSDFDRTVSGS